MNENCPTCGCEYCYDNETSCSKRIAELEAEITDMKANPLYNPVIALHQEYSKYKAENERLTAEVSELNAAMRDATDNPGGEYYTGLGCGLEDRDITDRYDAANFGWDQAFEYIQSIIDPITADSGSQMDIWTSEQPTEPRWYWWRQGDRVEPARVVQLGDKLVAQFCGESMSLDQVAWQPDWLWADMIFPDTPADSRQDSTLKHITPTQKMDDLIEELEMWAKHDPIDTSVPFGKLFKRAADELKFLDRMQVRVGALLHQVDAGTLSALRAIDKISTEVWYGRYQCSITPDDSEPTDFWDELNDFGPDGRDDAP